MDWFEYIVERCLQERGYWTLRGVYVDISKEDKRALNLPTMPRPQLDVVAYQPAENELLMLEAKSFLNSRGVSVKKLQRLMGTPDGHYRILTWPAYRDIVAQRLIEKLRDRGMLNHDPTIRVGLAAGNAPMRERRALADFASAHGWVYLSPEYLREFVRKLAERGYENTPEAIVAKLLAT